jgi:paraquat-inducible protein A
VTSLVACPDCGVVETLPAAPVRGRLECWRCGHVLENTTGRSLEIALACALTTLVLLVPANFMTLMTVRVAGIEDSTHLASGLVTAWTQHWPLVAIILGLQGIVLPFLRFGLLAVTLLAIRQGVSSGWVGPAFRWCQTLDRWAMADVLAIGFGVGYGRVASQIPVLIDPGGWCFLGAAIMTMITRASLDRRAVWRRIRDPASHAGPHAVACPACDLVLPPSAEGGPCPRCHALVDRRLAQSLPRTTALVAASWALVMVCYWLPMSALWEAGSPSPHSIIDGIMLLFTHGFWPLGILICLASVGIPLTKLAGLTWFLVATRRGSAAHLRLRTRLYRVIDAIGRWSNLDPFTVMIFAPMVQFAMLAHIQNMDGSLAFLSMVVLSMVAAQSFDPRLMWDAAGAQQDVPVVAAADQARA